MPGVEAAEPLALGGDACRRAAATIPRVLTLEPIGGLGNRMRVIDSGLAFARAFGLRLRVVWTRTPDLGCRFDALFEPIPALEVVERGWWANRLLRRVALKAGRYSRDIREPELEWLVKRGDLDGLARERSALVVTCNRFFSRAGGRLEEFVPVPSLRHEVERQVASFGPATIGVHVRRGDNGPALRHSPTEAFVDHMANLVASDAATTFFVCSDASEAAASLVASFPGRVLARPKVLDRTSAAGMRDAVVDLYALSRTRRILGSYFSSFSEIAAQIGGVELDVVRSGEP
jgi:hypothetical protein